MTSVAAGAHSPKGSVWMRWAGATVAVIVAMLAAPLPAAAADEEEDAGGVIIVGVPGLAWSDINAADTPTMWDLAGEGATAAMSVRTIGSWTCPEAGWVSLGAGERAGGVAPRDAQCEAQSQLPAPVQEGSGWTVPGWDELIEANGAYNYGARLGSLADAVANLTLQQQEAALEAEANGEDVIEPEPGTCVAGIGGGAALAAADTEGSITYWAPSLESIGEAMSQCDVVIVDPGVIVGDSADKAPDSSTDYDELGQDDTEVGTEETPEAAGENPGEIEPEADPVRAAAAAAADAAVAEVNAALPEDWRLIVAGLADASAPSALHPVLYSGAGVEAGDLTSSTTGREGYVQLVDLSATALGVIGADIPASMAGQPMTVGPDGDHTAASAVASGVDESQASAAVAEVGWKFYRNLTIAGIVAVAAAAWLLIGSDRFRRTARTVCIAVASVPVAGVAAGIPPWWRAEQRELVFWGLILAGVAVLTIAASLPWMRQGARPTLLVAGAAAALIAIDQVSGATWPLHTPMGYTASAGARFTGLGNYAFSVFAAAIILLVAFVPWRGRMRFWGPVALGVCAVVIVGAPTLGRDVGGTLTLVAAGVLACLKLWGRRLSIGAIAAAGGIAFGVFALGGFLDFLRPEEDQTHLGRFVASVLDGTAGEILTRKAVAAFGTIGSSLTYLCVAAVIAAILIWRKRAPIRSNVTAAAVVGLLAVAVIGGATNDSGVAIPGFTIAIGFMLLATAVGPRTEATEATAGTTVERAAPA